MSESPGTCPPSSSFFTADLTAGVAGIEPAHAGVGNRCLSAWLHPYGAPYEDRTRLFLLDRQAPTPVGSRSLDLQTVSLKPVLDDVAIKTQGLISLRPDLRPGGDTGFEPANNGTTSRRLDRLANLHMRALSGPGRSALAIHVRPAPARPALVGPAQDARRDLAESAPHRRSPPSNRRRG